MCGIVGCLPSPKLDLLEKSLSNISHRGPDGENIWISPEKDISMGHRRLAIIDCSDSASQPMHYLERYVITYNGEIYNFIELRKELEGLGHSFVTQSDTEVILAAYCQWKEKCLLKFNGMWSFAIWDKIEKILFLSRDRFGVKPLFYSFTENQLVFSSEMKGLFPFLKQIEPSEHFDWCKKHVFDYESTEKCLIKGVRRFPAGHFGYYSIGDSDIKKVRFWNTLDNLEEIGDDYNKQVEQFRELFIDAVKLRMRSDVRIGTTLSGGLDSSAVISTMSNINTSEERVSRDWQHAFVACFKGTVLDERKYAEQVVNNLGLPATYAEISPPEFSELYRMLYQCEELYITSPVPMIGIYEKMRNNNVVVSIDGHGADELLSGYGYDLNYALLDSGCNIDAIRNIQEAYSSRFPKDSQFRDVGGGIFEYLKNMSLILSKEVIKPKISRSYKDASNLGNFNSILYNVFHKTVLPTLLRNYDRYSMASGVEVRMPFMDYRIVTFLFSLPWTSKIRLGYTKAILRDAIGPFMPDSITRRKTKIGFNTPIINWIKNEWKEPLREIVNDKNFQDSELVNNHRKIKKQFEKIVAEDNVQYAAGERFWKGISPYLWEASLRHKQ